MKRKLLLTILSVVLLVSCLTGLALSAYAAESDWSGDGVTVAAGELGGTLVTNATGEEHGVTYAQVWISSKARKYPSPLWTNRISLCTWKTTNRRRF